MGNTSCDLEQLISTATQIVPRLSGQIGTAQSDQLVCGTQDNPQRISNLYTWWQHQHPEAGRHYWSVRSWTLLIWQPIYFTVLAVHMNGKAPCLKNIGQTVCDGFVGGFCLPEHCPRQGQSKELIEFAAGQIVEFLNDQLTEFNHVANIYPKLARLLAADCVVSALLLAHERLSLSREHLIELEALWMNALKLAPSSGLTSVRTTDGEEHMCLQRQVCCQHFRRHDGELCSTCPKLKKAERDLRLQAEFQAAC